MRRGRPNVPGNNFTSLSPTRKPRHSQTRKNAVEKITNTTGTLGQAEAGTVTSPDLLKYVFKSTSTHRAHIQIQYDSDPAHAATEVPNGIWEPPNWRVFLLNLRNMRSNQDAPVDSMGCHMTMDQNAAPEIIRYQSLISLMLSSQTKDQVTFAAMERLRARGLTMYNILEMSDDELGKLIYPVGFWKKKVNYIKKTTEILKNLYKGDIPDSVEKMCKLPGVGPKMAHICMKVAWNKVTGIGVDTHVHRISNRIGWVKKPTATPEDTRKALEAWLPPDLWGEVNHLLVGFGQTICQPIGPLCHECLNNDICPSNGLGRKSPKKTPQKSPNKEPLKDDETKLNLKTNKKLKLTPKKEAEVTCDNVEVKLDEKINLKKVKLEVDLEQDKMIQDDLKLKCASNDKMSTRSTLKNHDVDHSEMSTSKRKVIKKEQQDILKDNYSSKIVEEKTSPGKKRKVTPKKVSVDQNIPKDINDFRVIIDNLPVKSASTTKTSCAKEKKVSLSEVNLNENERHVVVAKKSSRVNKKGNTVSKSLVHNN